MKVKCIKGLRIEGIRSFVKDREYNAESTNSNLGNIKITDEKGVPIYFSTKEKEYKERFQIVE